MPVMGLPKRDRICTSHIERQNLSIRMGMRAATGAISRVALHDGQMSASVIGDVEARGICGSGLVDAVAAGILEKEEIENGGQEG